MNARAVASAFGLVVEAKSRGEVSAGISGNPARIALEYRAKRGDQGGKGRAVPLPWPLVLP